MNTEKQMSVAAAEFAERWKDRGYEKGESQPFWIDLLTNVFGIETPTDGFIRFEEHRMVDASNFIDGRIPSTLKNLTSHGKGNTFKVIKETLEELNYSIHYQVMDGQTYVSQHRERIMIVGFDRERYHGEEQFTFPEQHEATRAIREILDPDIDPKYTLSDKLWDYQQAYAEKHKAKGNGFGYGLVDLNGIDGRDFDNHKAA